MKIKKLLYSFAFTGAIASSINAQTTSIPNGNFENWTALTYELPQNYVWSSNSDALRNNLPFNVIKSTDAYHGNYAVQMTTQIVGNDTMPGIFVNVDPKDGDPANWSGGFPYNQTPTGMKGYYKSALSSPDTAFILAFFYKSGALIGQYGYYFYGNHSTYTPFSVNFTPALSQTPDTIIFGAGSSNFANMANMRNGSMLMLDSIAFTGVTSQPALFNGDFETWQSVTTEKPNDWYLEGDEGIAITTDAKAGNNAIELTTYEGERNNMPAAQAGHISTGWYPHNCNNNCYQQGGYPFSNPIDTLAFWYKHTPTVGSGTAKVYLNFKKNGSNIWGTSLTLNASTNYQYIEMPFNLGQSPDTVIVDIESSDWQDSALTFVGSKLIIDEIHFKSTPLTTGLFKTNSEKSISIFPNPTSGKIQITTLGFAIQQLEITNLLGEVVFSQVENNLNKSEIDLTNQPQGVYFVKINDGEKIHTKKIVIR